MKLEDMFQPYVPTTLSVLVSGLQQGTAPIWWAQCHPLTMAAIHTIRVLPSTVSSASQWRVGLLSQGLGSASSAADLWKTKADSCKCRGCAAPFVIGWWVSLLAAWARGTTVPILAITAYVYAWSACKMTDKTQTCSQTIHKGRCKIGPLQTHVCRTNRLTLHRPWPDVYAAVEGNSSLTLVCSKHCAVF